MKRRRLPVDAVPDEVAGRLPQQPSRFVERTVSLWQPADLASSDRFMGGLFSRSHLYWLQGACSVSATREVKA